MNNIGTTIKTYRLAAKLTQQQLAELAGVSHKSVISAIEHGKLRHTENKLLAKVCDALGLDIKVIVVPKEKT